MKFLQFIPAVLSLATSTLAQSFCSGASHSGQSVKETGNKVGSIGGVGYEMWADSGNNSATFYSDGSFSCSFSNAKDYLCRTGLSFDSTQSHSQIGHMFADFKLVKQNIANVDYSYVGIYGWTRNPLVEFYIVDNWLSQYRPGDWVGNKKHGDFTIDGAQYTVFENDRFGPSIDGDTQFKQYFSIRQTPRECGTIDISAHFAQWEKLGMTMGKMHEAKILGEAGSNGSGTSGTADFPYAKVYIGQGNGGGNGGAAQAPPQSNDNQGANFDQGNQWNQNNNNNNQWNQWDNNNQWNQNNNNNNQWNQWDNNNQWNQNNNNQWNQNNNNQWNQNNNNQWNQNNNNNQWNQWDNNNQWNQNNNNNQWNQWGNNNNNNNQWNQWNQWDNNNQWNQWGNNNNNNPWRWY
ncbi:concanavalin A-like lectin/glucanase [Piromyces finnis]|uniref:endo-1,4-beta-xylanase n=1 Tax=Piromyces finnis TaxID=1754191 RepID=A0A1Y1VLF6_9FUNG|nr:concanavalin A-like lectin/glucanase [Piromyces finnis]|eukprot:ORX59309.1 concanavalin A-like lectin/glucanase [Piromyces finnis]